MKGGKDAVQEDEDVTFGDAAEFTTPSPECRRRCGKIR